MFDDVLNELTMTNDERKRRDGRREQVFEEFLLQVHLPQVLHEYGGYRVVATIDEEDPRILRVHVERQMTNAMDQDSWRGGVSKDLKVTTLMDAVLDLSGVRDRHFKSIEYMDEKLTEPLPERDPDEDVRQVLREARAESCGLNGDWSVEAWCLGASQVAVPNRTQGLYYIIDDEDGSACLTRRFYAPVTEEEVAQGHSGWHDPNPYDNEVYEGDGMNDDMRVIAERPWTVEGVRELVEVWNNLPLLDAKEE